jgi:alpha-amylase
LKFASEWLVNLLAPEADDRYFEIDGVRPEDSRMRSSGVANSPRSVRLIDRWLRFAVAISPDDASCVVRYPIESVSLSEGGFEKVFQGSVVMPVWEVELPPDALWTGSISMSFSRS